MTIQEEIKQIFGIRQDLQKEIFKQNIKTGKEYTIEETFLEIVEAAKTSRPNCQNCTWGLRDDEDTKWMCMYPFDDFGYESSKCPKDKWFVEQFGR